jgi:hypothetical protein
MSRANLIGATQKGHNLEISFGRVHFLIFLKSQNKKSYTVHYFKHRAMLKNFNIFLRELTCQ